MNAPGWELFPSHRKLDRWSEWFGWAYLVAWWKTRQANRARLKAFRRNSGQKLNPIGSVFEPRSSPSLYGKTNWVSMEKRLRFNPALEALLDTEKSDEENREIARKYWSYARRNF